MIAIQDGVAVAGTPVPFHVRTSLSGLQVEVGRLYCYPRHLCLEALVSAAGGDWLWWESEERPAAAGVQLDCVAEGGAGVVAEWEQLGVTVMASRTLGSEKPGPRRVVSLHSFQCRLPAEASGQPLVRLRLHLPAGGWVEEVVWPFDLARLHSLASEGTGPTLSCR